MTEQPPFNVPRLIFSRAGGRKVFETVIEARLALSLDKLGTIYRRAKTVFVITASGSGTFPVDEWDRG